MLFSAETFSFFAAKYVVEETVYVFFAVEYSDVTWDTHARTIARKAATASCQPLLQHGWLMGVHGTPSNINCLHENSVNSSGTVTNRSALAPLFQPGLVWHGSMVQCEQGTKDEKQNKSKH